jgi:hypothetical protein
VPRGRLVVWGAAGLATAALLLVVLLRGGDVTEPAAAPAADPECVAAWNGDSDARELGRHQLGFHGYTHAQVLRVSEKGIPIEAGDEGPCAVAFAGATLDSEPGAAARVREGRYWRGLETLPEVTSGQLLEMQTDAQAAPNVEIAADGRLVPL